MKFSFTYLFLLLLFFSCEDPLEKQEDVPADLIKTTLDMFEGEVMEQGSTKLDDVDVWKVRIRNSSDAVTAFYWRKPFYNIFRIVGEQGPFEYNLNPPLDVINYQTARFLAVDQRSNGVIESWEFMRSPGEIKWYYKFHIQDIEFPVTVDAGSGEIIR